jgi:hypothetical protein
VDWRRIEGGLLDVGEGRVGGKLDSHGVF